VLPVCHFIVQYSNLYCGSPDIMHELDGDNNAPTSISLCPHNRSLLVCPKLLHTFRYEYTIIPPFPRDVGPRTTLSSLLV
jgi:hypothetical protein